MSKILISSVLFAVGLLSAAEIHVAKTGNDGNDGSADAPLASIAKAANLARPGDVVLIGPGVYREQITFMRSGAKGAPIVFAGTRGEGGEYLTIVEAPGTTLSNWEPAPEIAPSVWKTKLEKRPDLMMMDGDMIGYIDKRRMELPSWKQLPEEINKEDMFWGKFGPNSTRLPGFDLLRLPSDIKVLHKYMLGRKELLWPTVGYVFSGWYEGNLYVRFANGEKPENHYFTASYGECFTLNNASYLTFRDLHMRGSRKQFHLQGRSSNNTIEKCLLMHGGARIHINAGVKNTTIRDNVLTAGFISGNLCGHRSKAEMRSILLYFVFKHFIGCGSSDDVGLKDNGQGTIVTNNIFMQGLIGMDEYGQDVEVSGNVVRQMSSVGICSGATTSGKFHHNLVMDCGIPLRIHDLRHRRAKREEYHYSSLFVQPPNAGSQIYVHCSSHSSGDDVINFEPGTDVYKQNPPNPVDAGKIYIYHNTFRGGWEETAPMFDITTYSKRFRMVMPFYVVNNIFKDSYRITSKTHELGGPNLLYRSDSDIPLERRRYKDAVEYNKTLNVKESAHIWNKNDLPGLPDMTLAPDSPAIEAGVDVSKPFSFKGKDYPAFPGFKPGYYKGKAPAAGALQLGENQDYFIAMHKRAEATLKMLNELREKTAAEARRSAAGK